MTRRKGKAGKSQIQNQKKPGDSQIEKLKKPGDSSSSSSSSSSFQFQKLCVTATNIHPVDGWPTGYVIYFIDLSCSKYYDCPPLRPVLEMDFEEFIGSCMAVLGTKLYFFGGIDESKGELPMTDSSLYWINDVYVYDIKFALSSSSSSSSETPKLQKNSVHKRLDMRGRKYSPKAAVIDDDRICVFAAEVFFKQPSIERLPDPGFKPPNFELLDTRNNTWTTLPEIMDYDSMYCKDFTFSLAITSHFVSHSTLVVMTNFGILYRMDFNASEPKWEELSFTIPRDCQFHNLDRSGAIISDHVLCTPFQVVVMGDSPLTYPIPLREKGDKELYSPTGGLCSDDRLLYVARSGMKTASEESFLWVDILQFYEIRFSHPRPMNEKSLRFPLLGKFINVEGFFPVKIEDDDDNSVQA